VSGERNIASQIAFGGADRSAQAGSKAEMAVAGRQVFRHPGIQQMAL
jgi:hypothetical protein